MLKSIVGQPCTRREVGRGKSLSLGFGEIASDASRRNGKDYRKWEIGTYDGVWRVARGSVVLLSAQRSNDLGELNQELGAIELGAFMGLRQLSELDVRLELDNGVAVDFLGTSTDDDEYLHVFCPEKAYIEFSPKGWRAARSDEPWNATEAVPAT